MTHECQSSSAVTAKTQTQTLLIVVMTATFLSVFYAADFKYTCLIIVVMTISLPWLMPLGSRISKDRWLTSVKSTILNACLNILEVHFIHARSCIVRAAPSWEVKASMSAIL